ncbi:MAG: hypothetical protein IME96_08275, partial [Proteobacteria bacterium]|nr:hypothetical protein [Pseudomonadota bacterium]
MEYRASVNIWIEVKAMRLLKNLKVTEKEQKEVICNIEAFLNQEKSVLYSYIYGSFIEGKGFNDIDIAIYVDEESMSEDNLLQCQLELGVKLETLLQKYPIDCRLLNQAPLSFRFSVITEGELIFSRNENKRISFETLTRSRYFDFKPH